MNKFIIGGIGLAGLAVSIATITGIRELKKQCKIAHNAGLTLKEYRAARKNQIKKLKDQANAPTNPQVQNSATA
jgi:hypothetical protein